MLFRSVSFYDYYQPEAYIPHTDTFIERDARINDEINRLRLGATSALMSREDVIIVASVSCIYGLGSPEEYKSQSLTLRKGGIKSRNEILHTLVDIRYERNDIDRFRGNFRARGDVIEIFPAYADTAYRIELFGDEIDRITEINTVTGEGIAEPEEVVIFPAKHYMTSDEIFEDALLNIEQELQQRIDHFISRNSLLEAQRIEMRTNFDMEMMREMGFCPGIENYSRHLDGRDAGVPPYTLLDFFPDDYLLFVDESHVTLPQLRGMYLGDRSRKQTLVEHGFRLPSALDNRPLRFDEFDKRVNQVIFVSATPAELEIEMSAQIAEQLIRPTGLIDPEVSVRPSEGQIDDLIGAIRGRVEKNQRTLVTTLTKRMSEDLSEYLKDMGVKARYLHSEIQTLERADIIRELREGVFDVLVGINLMREGLDLPEVSLVAILDADSRGFLRSETAMIQVAGRAARNVDGAVIMYADEITPAMDAVIKETKRRRAAQLIYNEEHGITPATIEKAVKDLIKRDAVEESAEEAGKVETFMSQEEAADIIGQLEKEMREAAADLEFEKAAAIRDQLAEMKELAATEVG